MVRQTRQLAAPRDPCVGEAMDPRYAAASPGPNKVVPCRCCGRWSSERPPTMAVELIATRTADAAGGTAGYLARLDRRTHAASTARRTADMAHRLTEGQGREGFSAVGGGDEHGRRRGTAQVSRRSTRCGDPRCDLGRPAGTPRAVVATGSRRPGIRVFVGPNGGIPRRTNFQANWRDAVEKAGVSGLHFHICAIPGTPWRPRGRAFGS